MDKAIKEMIDKGVMTEEEAPFDDEENEFEEEEIEKIELPHTIKLEVPFEFADKKIEEITFKNRITAEMIMHLSIQGNHKHGHYIPIISQMTGEQSALIKKLSPIDLINCEYVVTYFFHGLDSTLEQH